MAACSFDRAFTGSATDLVARARKGIEGAGGTLTGDATGGTFRIATPVGSVEGSFAVHGSSVHFDITRKPFLVSCGTIESKVDEFLHAPAPPAPLAAAENTANAAAAESEVLERTISLSGSLFVLDHESIGENESDTLPLSATVALNLDVPNQPILSVAKGVGGEVRAEVRASAALLGNGAVNIDGRMLLFEGTSEATSDLDGEMAFSFVAPAGRRVENEYRVENTDEGGDYAVLRLVVVNLP
jgi:hypothetical protein